MLLTGGVEPPAVACHCIKPLSAWLGCQQPLLASHSEGGMADWRSWTVLTVCAAQQVTVVSMVEQPAWSAPTTPGGGRFALTDSNRRSWPEATL